MTDTLVYLWNWDQNQNVCGVRRRHWVSFISFPGVSQVQLGDDFVPLETSVVSGDLSGCHSRRGGCYWHLWVQTRVDDAKHFPMDRTTPPPPARELPGTKCH